MVKYSDEYEEGYTLRSISKALLVENSRINGVIKEFYRVTHGYSGIVLDESGQAPFYFDDDNIETYGDDGLVPILLKHSGDNNSPVTMDVYTVEDAGILMVEHLLYNMNGKPYEI